MTPRTHFFLALQIKVRSENKNSTQEKKNYTHQVRKIQILDFNYNVAASKFSVKRASQLCNTCVNVYKMHNTPKKNSIPVINYQINYDRYNPVQFSICFVQSVFYFFFFLLPHLSLTFPRSSYSISFAYNVVLLLLCLRLLPLPFAFYCFRYQIISQKSAKLSGRALQNKWKIDS